MTATTELFAQARALSPKWSIATDGLDAAQRQTILDRMRAISYDPRAILFDQGEPSDTLLLVTEGQVRLFQTLDNGEEFTFGVCVPGAILGLAATVTGQPRILSAQALEPATASIMTRDDFLHCLQAIPRFHWNITRLLAILSIESIERIAKSREDGLVTFRRDSQHVYYRIADPRVGKLIKVLKKLYCDDIA